MSVDTVTGRFKVTRHGWAGSGHYGTTGYAVVGESGEEEKQGQLYGVSPESLLGRNLAPGALVKVTVTVLEDGDWDAAPRGAEHVDCGGWRHCSDCCSELFTDPLLDTMEVQTEIDGWRRVFDYGTPRTTMQTYRHWCVWWKPLPDGAKKVHVSAIRAGDASGNWVTYAKFVAGDRMPSMKQVKKLGTAGWLSRTTEGAQQ